MRLYKNKVCFADYRGNRVDFSFNPEDMAGSYLLIHSRPRSGCSEFSSLDKQDTEDLLDWLTDQIEAERGVSA